MICGKSNQNEMGKESGWEAIRTFICTTGTLTERFTSCESCRNSWRQDSRKSFSELLVPTPELWPLSLLSPRALEVLSEVSLLCTEIFTLLELSARRMRETKALRSLAAHTEAPVRVVRTFDAFAKSFNQGGGISFLHSDT